MQQHVTAILVVSNGEQYLDRTLRGLADNRDSLDELITVDASSTDSSRTKLNELHPLYALSVSPDASFAEAVGVAVYQLKSGPHPVDSGDDGWLWILHDDCAPEPGALSALLAAVESAPSVGVAGPKLVAWNDRRYLTEFGISMTARGRAIRLAVGERDQSQFDTAPDVLAVGTAGMLVRRSVWAQLSGLDESLSFTDDGLDFGIRAHLAGYRVIRVAGARVAHAAGDGRDGTHVSRGYRATRWSELYRRLTSVSGLRGFWRWLMLLPSAVVASFALLLAKQPARIPAEIAAAISVAMSVRKIRVGRRRFAASKSQPWATIEPFFVTRAEIKQLRAAQQSKERARIAPTLWQQPDSFRYWATPVPWLIAVGLVLGLIVWHRFIGSAAVVGGGSAPLSQTFGQVWTSAFATFSDPTSGLSAPPDAFVWVLAILSCVTPWQPSLAIVVLYFAAFPLAVLGGGVAVGRITQSARAAAVGGIAWMLAPPFLVALAEGRVAAIIVHLCVPFAAYLVVAGCDRRLTKPQAVTYFAGAAALGGVVAACAPSTALVMIALLVVLIVARPRLSAITVWTIVPALVLLAPTFIRALRANDLLSVLADPGIAVLTHPISPRRALTMQPVVDPLGLSALAHAFGLGHVAWVTVVPAGVLIALALVALATRMWRSAAWGYGVFLIAGVAAAVFGRIAVSSVEGTSSALWTGSVLSIAFFGLVVAATSATEVRRAGIPLAWVSAALIIAFAAPWVVSAIRGHVDVVASSTQTTPAIARAAADGDPRAQMLTLSSRDDGVFTAQVASVAGGVLDQTNAVVATDLTVTSRRSEVAELAANLATASSGFDFVTTFHDLGVHFVLYSSPSDDSATRAALMANPALSYVSDTSYGALWSVVDPQGAAPAQEFSWAQLIARGATFIFVLLLAIPTSRPQRGYVEKTSDLLQPVGGDDDDDE